MLACTGADDSGRLHVAVDATFRHRLNDHCLMTDANPNSLESATHDPALLCNKSTRTVWRLQVCARPPAAASASLAAEAILAL
jgi:hypothetical protein